MNTTSRCLALVALVAAVSGPLSAQRSSEKSVVGTWRILNGGATATSPNVVVIRGDSSVTWGKEVARWRQRGAVLSLAVGGEWEHYRFRLSPGLLVLEGGDLTRPVRLTRVGDATLLPAGQSVPPDPDGGR